MSRQSPDDLGHLQRAVLEIVWQLGQATVHQVREKLPRRRKLAYTTVLTALQNLEKAGWLRHKTQGKSYIYLPARTRAQAGANSLTRLLKRAFDGDPFLMFQHLIKDGSLKDTQLQTLKKMIDEKRKEKK
ncbi:MAG: BlaI/MecI/CopY family transcriptional regulator [Planctomycetes bacterium]|nr:BlaI/MecI/CopY family transcriptional regulator [Planctomycetota bacterium]